MATIHFNMTNTKPNVLFGARKIRFDKLVIREGSIDNLAFLLTWENEREETAGAKTLEERYIIFNPQKFIDNGLARIEGQYVFRAQKNIPVYLFGENRGVQLVADGEKPLDLDIYLEIDPMK